MDIETGPFGIGGIGIEAAHFLFRGRLDLSFVKFAVERARRLALDGWIEDGDFVSVVVVGDKVLVDAFEMACILGPADCEVTEWEREVLLPELNASKSSDPPAGVNRHGAGACLAAAHRRYGLTTILEDDVVLNSSALRWLRRFRRSLQKLVVPANQGQ
jgi:acylphosphatase